MKKSTHVSRLTILIVLLMVILSSCKEDEEASPDKTKLLISSQWKFSEEVSLDAANAALVNTLLNTSTLTFNEDGVLGSNFFSIDGTNTWVMNADETAIIIDQGLESEDEWIIVSLTETEFIYRDVDDDDEGGEALPFILTDGKPLELKFIH